MAIRDTQVRGGYTLHIGTVEGTIMVGDKFHLLIDGVRMTITLFYLVSIASLSICTQTI